MGILPYLVGKIKNKLTCWCILCSCVVLKSVWAGFAALPFVIFPVLALANVLIF